LKDWLRRGVRIKKRSKVGCETQCKKVGKSMFLQRPSMCHERGKGNFSLCRRESEKERERE